VVHSAGESEQPDDDHRADAWQNATDARYYPMIDGTIMQADQLMHCRFGSSCDNGACEYDAPVPVENVTFTVFSGTGSTAEAQSRSFRAADLAAGTCTFRLPQVDYDGQYEYSTEVEVTVELAGSHALSAVYPNPFNPQAQFTLTVRQSRVVTVVCTTCWPARWRCCTMASSRRTKRTCSR
jgi:hypothetical protein